MMQKVLGRTPSSKVHREATLLILYLYFYRSVSASAATCSAALAAVFAAFSAFLASSMAVTRARATSTKLADLKSSVSRRDSSITAAATSSGSRTLLE